MKKIVMLAVTILCITLVVLGKNYYDKRVASSVDNSLLISNEENNNELLELTRNMNPDLSELIMERINNNEKVSILVMGSNAILTGDAKNLPWPIMLKEKLDTSYGQDVFELNILNFEDSSTYHIIETNGHLNAASFKSDIVLFEPLLLNDNGIVLMEHTLENIDFILNSIKNESPNAFVILQPANPLKDAPVYLSQEEALQGFAEENGYEYFDHWNVWPTAHDLDEYLTGGYPNNKGHEIWAKYIITYFVSE